jgi:hypothetical protein
VVSFNPYPGTNTSCLCPAQYIWQAAGLAGAACMPGAQAWLLAPALWAPADSARQHGMMADPPRPAAPTDLLRRCPAPPSRAGTPPRCPARPAAPPPSLCSTATQSTRSAPARRTTTAIQSQAASATRAPPAQWPLPGCPCGRVSDCRPLDQPASRR